MILTRTYERDYSGLVTKINRPGGRYTRYCYDKLGRVIRADYYDKTYENFTYNKNGALIEAENQYGKVKFERDSLGRITKEWQGRQFFYDEEGKKVWKRNLDIYGRVKTEEVLGKKNFIPFRFQGQYEDEETELYYNRFRYYDSQQGQYTQQDPIGLAGGNPTLYGYVCDTNIELDLLGLFKVWRNLRPDEVVSDGLSAKLPGRNMSIAGHLMNGSRHNGAQFISTTTDPKVIEKWNEPGQRIVMFDTDDVIPDVLGNKNIIDVSTPEKARAAGLKRGRPYSNAVSSKEVLVEGRVPANKLTITCPG